MMMIALGEKLRPAGLLSDADRARSEMPAGWWRSAARHSRALLGTWWHCLLLLVLGAAWGLQFTLLKISVDAHLDESGILACSMALLAALYALLLTCRRDWFRPSWRRLRFFLVSSNLSFVVPLGAVILAARQLPAGLIVLHESLTPVCIVVLALLLRCETVSVRRLAAIALGMAAVLLVLWPQLLGLGSHCPIGLLFALLIPISYGADAIYVAVRWPDGLSCVQVITGELIGAAVLSLPLYLIAGDPVFVSAAPTVGGVAVLAFVLVTFVETHLYFHLLRNAGAVFISVASFVALFAGIFWGMALNGESHPATVWLAVALIVIALCLIARRSSDEPGAPAAS
jgi:drug/metabolite transporter (DMT)-like permease